LAGDNCCAEEDAQGQPLFRVPDCEGVKRLNQEKIKGQESYHRGENSGIQPACAGQGQNYHQVNKRDIGDTRIKMQTVENHCHREGSQQGHKRIPEKAPHETFHFRTASKMCLSWYIVCSRQKKDLSCLYHMPFQAESQGELTSQGLAGMIPHSWL